MYTFEEPTEVKLLILYIIKNYQEPIDNGQITDVFMTHAFVDYFTMQQYLNELVSARLVDVDTKSGRRYYFLTNHGEEAYQSFIGKIPRTVREKLLLTIRAYKKQQKASADIQADYAAINDLEYAAHCEIRESGFPLMELRLTVGSKETAMEACRRFREEPQKVYAALFRILTENESEKTE